MEIDILCLLKEPACHLLASDFGELVFVLQTFTFGFGFFWGGGAEMAEYQPYISLLKFGICLQVVSSPLRLTAALTTPNTG